MWVGIGRALGGLAFLTKFPFVGRVLVVCGFC